MFVCVPLLLLPLPEEDAGELGSLGLPGGRAWLWEKEWELERVGAWEVCGRVGALEALGALGEYVTKEAEADAEGWAANGSTRTGGWFASEDGG